VLPQQINLVPMPVTMELLSDVLAKLFLGWLLRPLALVVTLAASPTSRPGSSSRRRGAAVAQEGLPARPYRNPGRAARGVACRASGWSAASCRSCSGSPRRAKLKTGDNVVYVLLLALATLSLPLFVFAPLQRSTARARPSP
jgi:hypothetical protein